ncbi:MAG TPA: hypothetical protein VFN21_12775 [Acidimicrobiales bacterium]|nr:hypothetical protein [Acidimicrobiales bacterium]
MSASDAPSDPDPKVERDGSDAAPTEELLGPNQFADNSRRRIPGVLYCCIGIVAGAAWLLRAGDDPVLLNLGVGIAGALLIVFGVYSILTGRRLEVDEEDALLRAAVAVQRPMGHASAQMGWRGWSSRPTWRILWYSAENPPRHRGLVLVDGLDGEVLDLVSEDNPEADLPIDWTLEDEPSGTDLPG